MLLALDCKFEWYVGRCRFERSTAVDLINGEFLRDNRKDARPATILGLEFASLPLPCEKPQWILDARAKCIANVGARVISEELLSGCDPGHPYSFTLLKPVISERPVPAIPTSAALAATTKLESVATAVVATKWRLRTGIRGNEPDGSIC